MAKVANKIKGDAAVTFDWVDDKYPRLVCQLHQLPEHIINELALHGLSQKVGDSYAGALSVSEAVEKAEATWQNLQAGEWGTKRDSNGGDLLLALIEATGQVEAECKRILSAMSKEDKQELRKHSSIKPILLRMDAERKAAKAQSLAKQGEDSKDSLDSLFA